MYVCISIYVCVCKCVCACVCVVYIGRLHTHMDIMYVYCTLYRHIY